MKLSQKLLFVFIFSVSMAYLESAVVVYLRELYYPNGFLFPIKLIPEKIILIELGRESATILMLFSVALISGKLFAEKISFFLFAFGVWDIFYYLWLKVLINWPESLLTDDLLFLIPVPWISPVLAPVIVSVVFILFSYFSLKETEAAIELKFNLFSIALIITGVGLIFICFIWDYEKRLVSESPVDFMWLVFIAGLLIMSTGLFCPVFRKKKQNIISRKNAEPQA